LWFFAQVAGFHLNVLNTLLPLVGLPKFSAIFFPSGSADVALRLGPEIGINTSNEFKTPHDTVVPLINCVGSQKHQNKTKKAKRQTTRKSSSEIYVSPREATAKTQQKNGPGPKANQNTQELPHDTEGVSHRITKTCRK